MEMQAYQLYATVLRQRAFDVAGSISAPQPTNSDSYYEDSYTGVAPLDSASMVAAYTLAAGFLRQVRNWTHGLSRGRDAVYSL